MICVLFGLRQAGYLLDEVHRKLIAGIPIIVGADHHAIRTDHLDEVAHDLRAVADGVVMEAAQVGAGQLLHMLELRAPPDAVVPSSSEPGKRATRVRQQDLQIREGVEHAPKNQAGRADRRFMRVTNEIGEMILAHSLLAARRHGMQAERQLQGSQALVDRPEGAVVEIHAIDVQGHVDAAHAGQARGAFQFLHRKLRRLHGQHDRAAQLVRMRLAGGRAGVVVGLRQLHAEAVRRPIHHRIGQGEDAQVDARLLHVLQDGRKLRHVLRKGLPERKLRSVDHAQPVFVGADKGAVRCPSRSSRLIHSSGNQCACASIAHQGQPGRRALSLAVIAWSIPLQHRPDRRRPWGYARAGGASRGGRSLRDPREAPRGLPRSSARRGCGPDRPPSRAAPSRPSAREPACVRRRGHSR